MIRQTIAILTLGSFAAFSCACLSTPAVVRPEQIPPAERHLQKVLSAATKSGELIEFKRGALGRIKNSEVTGKGLIGPRVEVVEVATEGLRLYDPPARLTRTAVSADKTEYSDVMATATRGDRTELYLVKRGERRSQRDIMIPLADVSWLTVLGVDHDKAALDIAVWILTVGAVALVTYLIASSDWRSWPR